jgi:hypothetical protein
MGAFTGACFCSSSIAFGNSSMDEPDRLQHTGRHDSSNDNGLKAGRGCLIAIGIMLVLSIIIAPLDGRDIVTVFFDLMKMLVGAFLGVRV